MKFCKIFVLILMSMVVLSGCQSLYGDAGLVHDRRNDYLASVNGKKIILPNTLQAEPQSTRYLIPEGRKELKLVASIVPPESLASKTVHQDRIVTQPALDADALSYTHLAAGNALLVKQPHQQAWLTVATALRRQRFPTLEVSEDKTYFKIADTFQQEAGLSGDWMVYYLYVTPKSDQETLIRLAPIVAKQHFNKRIESRLLAQVEAGIKGKQKPRSLLNLVKSYV